MLELLGAFAAIAKLRGRKPWGLLDRTKIERHKFTNAHARNAPRKGKRNAQLKIMKDHVSTIVMRPDDLNRSKALRGCKRTSSSITKTMIISAAMAALTASGVGAQPQPAPRPRDNKAQAQSAQAQSGPKAEAPTTAQTQTSSHPPSQSRQEWRALHRACAQEWSQRKMAGRTTGLIWIEFFEHCSNQR